METSNPFRRSLAGGMDGSSAPSTLQTIATSNLPISPERNAKPLPPAVTPRKRASRNVELKSPIPDTLVPTTSTLPAVPTSRPDGSDAHDSSSNPFTNTSDSPTVGRSGRSTPSELPQSAGTAGAIRADTAHVPENRLRRSLDPEAFKHLMLTGEYLPPGSTVSTDKNASLPRVLEQSTTVLPKIVTGNHPPTSEAFTGAHLSTSAISDNADLDRLRRSLDITRNEQTDALESPSVSAGPSPSLSRSSSTRVRPPPPKPRTRSNKSVSMSTPLNLSAPSSPPRNRAETSPLNRLPPPPPPPPPSSNPQKVVEDQAPRTAEPEKRKPPPPPLSRRHSVQVRASTPLPEGKVSLPPPPPPPVRRVQSAAARNSWSPGSSLPPIPPTPPLGPDHDSPQHGVRGQGDGVAEGLSVVGEEEGTSDILSTLEKLQREVDELRGKLAVGV